MALVAAHGLTPWTVWAWPATTDLAGLVGMLIALDQMRRKPSTWMAWLIAFAAAAVMVAANVGSTVGDPIAMLLHAWPPTIALACWYLLVHVRHATAAKPKPTSASTEQADTLSNRQARVPARAAVRELLKRQGARLTP